MSVIASAKAEKKQFLQWEMAKPVSLLGAMPKDHVSVIPYASETATLCQHRTRLLSHSLLQDFGVLHCAPLLATNLKGSARSKPQEKTHLDCINYAMNKGVQQESGGEPSAYKSPLEKPAELSCPDKLSSANLDVKSNSCCTTSKVPLQIFHFRTRSLEHVKNPPTSCSYLDHAF